MIGILLLSYLRFMSSPAIVVVQYSTRGGAVCL